MLIAKTVSILFFLSTHNTYAKSKNDPKIPEPQNMQAGRFYCGNLKNLGSCKFKKWGGVCMKINDQWFGFDDKKTSSEAMNQLESNFNELQEISKIRPDLANLCIYAGKERELKKSKVLKTLDI